MALPRAILFDMDRTLIDRRRAWQYTLEQTVAVVTGRRISTEPLIGEYLWRPWRDVLGIVLDAPEGRDRGVLLCEEMMRRSAMKRLLVFEGVGMALDVLRSAKVELGVISREAHPVALKQAQSTGIDRFMSVMAATPDGEAWDAGARYAQCLRFLEYRAEDCLAVVATRGEALAAATAGLAVALAGWIPDTETPGLGAPAQLLADYAAFRPE